MKIDAGVVAAAAEDATVIGIAEDSGCPPEYVVRAVLVALRNAGSESVPVEPVPATPEPAPTHEPLSDRELQVMQVMSLGRTNQGIASELSITEDTVKSHTRRIYAKLGVADRAGAVALLIRGGRI